MTNNVVSVLIAIVVIILLLIFAPFLTLWALNTLFPSLQIPYNMETWAATIFLTAVIQSVNLGIKTSKDK